MVKHIIFWFYFRLPSFEDCNTLPIQVDMKDNRIKMHETYILKQLNTIQP